MNNTLQTALVSGIVSLIVAGALWGFLPAKTPVVGVASFGNTSIDGSQSNLPSPSNYDYLVARLALGLGTNTSNINQEGQRMVLVAATTTPCAIQNPLNATSTVTSFSFNVNVATSSSLTLTVGTSTTAFATSSSMVASAVIAGSAEGTVTWDPGVNNGVIGPSQYIVAGTGAGTGVSYGYTLGGSCQATFQSAT